MMCRRACRASSSPTVRSSPMTGCGSCSRWTTQHARTRRARCTAHPQPTCIRSATTGHRLPRLASTAARPSASHQPGTWLGSFRADHWTCVRWDWLRNPFATSAFGRSAAQDRKRGCPPPIRQDTEGAFGRIAALGGHRCHCAGRPTSQCSGGQAASATYVVRFWLIAQVFAHEALARSGKLVRSQRPPGISDGVSRAPQALAACARGVSRSQRPPLRSTYDLPGTGHGGSRGG